MSLGGVHCAEIAELQRERPGRLFALVNAGITIALSECSVVNVSPIYLEPLSSAVMYRSVVRSLWRVF